MPKWKKRNSGKLQNKNDILTQMTRLLWKIVYIQAMMNIFEINYSYFCIVKNANDKADFLRTSR